MTYRELTDPEQQVVFDHFQEWKQGNQPNFFAGVQEWWAMLPEHKQEEILEKEMVTI